MTALLFLVFAAGGVTASPPGSGPLAAVKRLYGEGILPSGEPLRARGVSGEVTGAQAACVLCHRRSGLGTFEGNRLVPPIAGRYLFTSRAGRAGEMNIRHTRGPDLAHALGRDRPRPPYTEASLLAAIRDGRSSTGEPLDPLMPRFTLGDDDGRRLIAYLRELSRVPSPGISEEGIRLATVIAPGVAAERRRALVDVLESWVALRNNAIKLERLRDQSSPGASQVRYRRWELQIWDLTGPAAGWEAQLEARYRKAPVFALLSGLSEGEWSPVERFAERTGIPDWFPTVDLPPLAEGAFYSTYFTSGVRGEAEVLARRLAHGEGIARVVQLKGQGPAEEAAARALAGALRDTRLSVEDVSVDPASIPSLKAVLGRLGPSDVLVLWLRPALLRVLGEASPPPGRVYLSGLLGGGEHAPLTAGWRSRSVMVYPFELPDRRRATGSRFLAWLRTRNLPLVDERVQAEAYLAAQLLGARLEDMLEDLQRDYLLERAESFLAERVSPVLFRKLELSVGQRIASRGAYLVRFAGQEGTALQPDGEWTVP